VAIIIAGCLCLSITLASADTYRWKDKDGKTHYGAAVPAEYADQPYDVLNNAGIVIERVEDTAMPMDVRKEQQVKERAPLISEEERRIQSDRILVIQYGSTEDIEKAMELEISQLGYDTRLINQSYASTSTAIRNQIRQAAEQQRANQKITAEQQQGIDKLYARRARDEQKRATLSKREDRIRARFQADLERFRFLTEDRGANEEERADQG
jgi:hypothetical protein